jgi:putative RNA 2'-phosphotransferase
MKKYSKLLSFVLRHEPESLQLKLDEQGWIAVETLVIGVQQRYPEFTTTLLDEVVKSNEKKRFEYDDTRQQIRACQGHSVKVDLKLPVPRPPYMLYHGTTLDAWTSIAVAGQIEKRSRHAVHLSEKEDVAVEVGSRRRGQVIVLKILAEQMADEGYTFHQSANGVWLTDVVPIRYIVNGYRVERD